LSNSSISGWMVEAAMTAEELAPGGASYVVLARNDTLEHTERVYEHVEFASAQVFQAIRLTVWRKDGYDNVHIVDWWLDALNPACGQGVDLSGIAAGAFSDDVDGIVRTGSWDIGADQSTDVEVGFAGTARWWWESEEEARIEVVLAQPVEDAVAVRYRTHNMDPISAIAGVDYDYMEGYLVFEPGTYSQTISVPLNNDGSGDEYEVFAIQLFDPEGARLGRDWWEVEIREGDPPPRARLVETVVNVGEGESVVSLDIELSSPSAIDVFGTWDAYDHTAHIAVDYEGPPESGSGTFSEYVIPAGATTATMTFTILDDAVSEAEEGFVVRYGWSDQVQPGVPATAYIRILDDDGVTP